MYAIVDIETTGGYAATNCITEIAIIIVDGEQEVERFETLINPDKNIPVFISALTGITNEMVIDAPKFVDVALHIYNLINDKIFIAHNVNFDYSFLKHHLAQEGFDLQCKKLCTVRFGRKIFPGLASYSLRKLCTSLNIPLINHHRAGGDAEATAKLFSLLLQKDSEGHIKTHLHRNSKEQQLPPNLLKKDIESLPSAPGVYYFNGRNGKAIYVGKAKNLKKRVCSHFAGNNAGKQRQEFIRNIHSVSYKICSSELMAFIMEAVEIKRLWPENNRAMKRFEQGYGLYKFEDQKGYLRLALDKRNKHSVPCYKFNSLLEGHTLLKSLIKEFSLCPKLCFQQKNNNPCTGIDEHYCRGGCNGEENASLYNERVQQAIQNLNKISPTFALVEPDSISDSLSCIVMERGVFYGMGNLKSNYEINNLETLKEEIQKYSSNEYICNLISKYASQNPERIVQFQDSPIIQS